VGELHHTTIAPDMHPILLSPLDHVSTESGVSYQPVRRSQEAAKQLSVSVATSLAPHESVVQAHRAPDRTELLPVL